MWLLKIDEFILERIFTPVAWWIERKTGKTNFYLAWWSIALSLLCWLLSLGTGFIALRRLDLLDVFSVLAISWIFYRLMKAAQKQDEVIRRQPHQFVLKEFAPLYRMVRVLLLVTSLEAIAISIALARSRIPAPRLHFLMAETSLLGVAMLFAICGSYLMAVRRPPPCPRRETAPERNLAPVMT